MGGFLHWIAILSYTSSYEKCMGRKTIEWEKPEKLISGKILQNPSCVENLGNWYSYFSYSMDAFFQLDLHSMVYFIK